MPRFLRLKNSMIHVPSVSSVSMSSGCFGRPSITLYYHITKNIQKINYSEWDLCEKDFNRVKKALNEIEAMVSSIPLTEETVPVSVPEIVTKESVKVEVETPKTE